MFDKILPFAAVLLVGAGIAIETPTNALLMRLSRSTILASLFSFLAGTLVLSVAALVTRPKLPTGFWTGVPAYAWMGGVYGAYVVLASAWATPRLGAGTTLVLIVAAQVALGVVLDQFGLLGLKHHAASLLRILGVVVVGVGAALVAAG